MRDLIDIINESVEVTPESLRAAMQSVLKVMSERTFAKSPEDINAGLCSEFSNQVMIALGLGPYGRAADLRIINTKYFYDDGDRNLDLDKLRAMGEPVPLDLPDADMARELGRVHFWLLFKGRHYDAENLDGVDHFLELAYFQRVIAWMRSQKAPITEGRVHELNTGYGSMVRMTRVYQNPVAIQAQTMAQDQMNRNDGRLYLRGIMFNGKTVLVTDGWACTHDDLMQEFYPGKEASDPRFTSFEITNYAGGNFGAATTPTFPAKVETTKQGNFDAETSPHLAKIIAGCRAASSD